jgi:IS30 family transposase
MMWVSHQSIYQACTCRAAASCAGELAPLPAHRAGQAPPAGRGEHTGQLRDLVMISQRAAEADDRAVPGHWEGDRADRSLRLLA